MRSRLLALLSLLSVAACSSASTSPGTPPGPAAGGSFSFAVDAALAPLAPSLTADDGSARPLVAFRDADGVRTDFVADELLVIGASDAELSDLLARYDGKIVVDHPAEASFSRRVLVRIAKPIGSLSTIGADASALGAQGAYTFGSDAAVRLFATAAHETAAGRKVTPNFVGYPATTFLRKTEEGPMNGGYADAFTVPQFRGMYGANLVAAWQIMEWLGYKPASIPVAILDGGFWLDDAGHPYDGGMGTDLPSDVQSFTPTYPVIKQTAGGENPNTCTGGSPCPWHGNRSASVATGPLNNRKGAVGTGGQVAVPMLFKHAGDDDGVVGSLRNADALGARVLNMSFGGSCNGVCRFGRTINGYESAISRALEHGRVLVASAGNDNLDVDAEHVYPCTLDGVVCVGAHDSSGNGYYYSNYGSKVTLFAPTDIPAMPDGATNGALAVHGGTSASAPYVSGVVAMVLARAPNLSPGEVKNLLVTTAVQAKSIAKVGASAGYLDARAAVQAAGGLMPPDAHEPNDVYNQPTIVTGDVDDLSLSKADKDYFHFSLADYSTVDIRVDNQWEGFLRLAPVPEVESGPGNPDGTYQANTATGSEYVAALAPGEYRFLVSGKSQRYDLKFSKLVFGLQPDQFETNDTFAQSTWLPAFGAATVNLHTATDVDYYRLSVPYLASNDEYFFSIVWSDYGVTLDLLDDNGAVTSTRTGNTPYYVFDSLQSLQHPFVRVSGARGRYRFSRERFHTPPNAPPQVAVAKLPWIDPSDPASMKRLLTGVDGWVGLTPTTSAVGLPPAVAISLTTESSLRFELFDAKGTLVSAAQPAPGGAQRIDLTKATIGQDYFVHVARDIVPDDGVPLPVLSYDVAFER